MRHSALQLIALLWLLPPLMAKADDPPYFHDPNAPVRLLLQAELEDFSVKNWLQRPKSWLPALNQNAVFYPHSLPAIENYRVHLLDNGSWDKQKVWHQMGSIPFITKAGLKIRLGINVFLPSGPPVGTLLFLHGYLSHAANFAYTFSFFTARGYAVVTLDLPGHGLSEGPRGDIESFEEYGDAVGSWMQWVSLQNAFPSPKILMAHSLGGAASYDFLRRKTGPIPEHIVLCAPLIRPAWYPLVELGNILLGWAFPYVPTTLGWDSYLDGYTIPTHWISAVTAWNSELEAHAQAIPENIFLLWGDKDKVVDNDWSIHFIRNHVPDLVEYRLQGASHLFISGEETRDSAHQLIANLLNIAAPKK